MRDTTGPLEPIGGAELEYFLLTRLERFAALVSDPTVTSVPAWRRLARHATAVALQDCLALGLGDEARVIVSEAARPSAGRAHPATGSPPG
jgi:hypothetical protein